VTGRIALVFPGQGSQRHGMLDDLPQTASLTRLLDAAEALSGLDLRAVAAMGTPDRLADTRAAQPLLYLADWAWGSEALAAGVVAIAVAGHSLGELAALAIADVYSVEAGLELVVQRSRLMAECASAHPGGMSAVLGLDAAVVASVCDPIDEVWVANDNAPGQVVISGTREGVAEASEALATGGARKVVPLAVAGAFHTPLMRGAAEAFRGVLDRTEFRDASLPVYSDTAPSAELAGDVLRRRLAGQITGPVRWTGIMEALVADGCDTLLECGPGAVLSGLAKRVPGLTGHPVENAGIATVLEGEGARS
jgi:[acyl-carrier-protein] S-malonyltransferase